MLVVGLTGGIGSGKSTVSAMLAERGAVIIDADADAVAHDLQQPGRPVFEAMVQRWGDTIVGPDGTLDRAAIASRVFADSDELTALNDIVHPPVIAQMRRHAAEYSGADAVVVMDIPILNERRSYLAAILVVDTPVDVAVARLVEHRGMAAEDVRARMANQIGHEARLALADVVIDNSGTVESLEAQVDEAWQRVVHLQASDVSAADVAWDIEQLLDGEGTDALLDRADALVPSIEEYRGRVGELDAAGLAGLMTSVAELHELMNRALSYVSLRFAVDTTDGASYQHATERATAISTRVLFVDLEWAAASDEYVASVIEDKRLAFCRHHLLSERRYRDHLLTEPEERLLTEKDVTGRSAWSRLFDELTSDISVALPDGDVALE